MAFSVSETSSTDGYQTTVMSGDTRDDESDGSDGDTLQAMIHRMELGPNGGRLTWGLVGTMTTGRSFEFDWKLTEEILGVGMCGNIRAAVHKRTGQKVAVKIFDWDTLSRRERKDLSREIIIHHSMHHPNVARLLNHALHHPNMTRNVPHADNQQPRPANSVCLVLEHLKGGDLRHHLKDKVLLSEAEIVHLIKQVLQAVEYMHDTGVVHRDIKLENLLSDSKSWQTVKVIDFGLSAFWREGGAPMRRICGTASYAAPEMMEGSYTNKVDLWCIGVCTHVLLTGKMLTKDPDTNSPVFSERLEARSIEAQKFVAGLLTTDPVLRMSASQALRHSWIRDADGCTATPILPSASCSPASGGSSAAPDVPPMNYSFSSSESQCCRLGVCRQKEETRRQTVGTEAPEVRRRFWQRPFRVMTAARRSASALWAAVRRTTHTEPEMQVVPHHP